MLCVAIKMMQPHAQTHSRSCGCNKQAAVTSGTQGKQQRSQQEAQQSLQERKREAVRVC